jgi:hypothetical protein
MCHLSMVAALSWQTAEQTDRPQFIAVPKWQTQLAGLETKVWQQCSRTHLRALAHC